MPGLEVSEYDRWDKKNLFLQNEIADSNVTWLLNGYFTNRVPEEMNISFKKRYQKYLMPPQEKDGKKETQKIIFELQRDMGACILLMENGFNFSKYQGDTTDLYGVAEEFIRRKGSCPTELSMQFPQIVQDAVKAIKTDGTKPPANEMQKIEAYISKKADAII